MPSTRLNHDSRGLLALLAALVALGPLSVDMYLPAMPAMKADFGTDIAQMHLTLSSYLTGFASFHLLCGPLADRFGRRPVLLSGTALFVLACIGCSLSDSVEEILVYRFVQGVGACVGPTLARTVVRDVFGPVRAARALSIIAMLMALAPAVAPLLGGVALLVMPWPSIFLFLAAYGAVMIYLIQRFLGETLPQRQGLHPLIIARNYTALLRDGNFIAAIGAGGLCYAGLMIYLASSSFVFIDMYGVPSQYYGLIFLTSVVGYMAGSALSARLSSRLDSEQVLGTGGLLALGACLMTLACWALAPQQLMSLVFPMVFYSCALGLVLPHSMTIALRHYPHVAGTASSLLGFVQMTLSSVATALVGLALRDSPAPMIWSMVLMSALSLVLTAVVYRNRNSAGAAVPER